MILLFLLILLVSGGKPLKAITFAYTGATQSYTVPEGIIVLLVQAYGSCGSSGGGSPGIPGKGGFVNATLDVTPGQVLQIEVGNYFGYTGGWTQPGGYNGGGDGDNYQGGGGGASDVRVSPYGLQNRVIVAGGGGAAGYISDAAGVNGGDGGEDIGQGGDGDVNGGGTQTSGGAGSNGGGNGTFGQGILIILLYYNIINTTICII